MKRYNYLLIAAITFFPLSLMAQQQRFVAEELAAIVGGSPVMLSEIERATTRVIENRKTQGTFSKSTPREEAFETLLMQRLLSSVARADSLDKDMNTSAMASEVEKQVQKMIDVAGGARNLERLSGRTIYQTKRELEKDYLEQNLAQQMEQVIRRKVSINYSDVAKFFGRLPTDSLPMIPPQYTYAQIVRTPPATQERKYAIREQLLEYRQRVLDGERLAVLAMLYSEDPSSKSRGGEIGPQNINDFVMPFADALDKLKPGQLSEIVETEYGYHIIELISRQGDMVHFRQLLLKPQFTVEEITQVTHELDSISEAITQGKCTFAEAAYRYSDDKQTRMNGGTVFNTTAYERTQDIKNASRRFVLDELMPAEYRALKPLKIGEVSETFETMNPRNGDIVYKIIKLDILPSHTANLHDDYEILQMAAMQDKQSVELEKWLNENIMKMYVWIAPEYRQMNINPHWMKSMDRNPEKLSVPIRSINYV
ncbi:MAG: peptidylprolyl isomerase, partial [Mucinivorans sp.]